MSDFAAWQVGEINAVACRFGDSHLAAVYRERYWNADLFAAVERLTAIATGAGVPLAELALRWLAGSPDVHAPLLGGSKAEHHRQHQPPPRGASP